MARIKIELNRGNGWQVRQEGDCDVTEAALIAMMPSYAIQYPHRAFIDGKLVCEFAAQKKARR
jgi:hypothetical protein